MRQNDVEQADVKQLNPSRLTKQKTAQPHWKFETFSTQLSRYGRYLGACIEVEHALETDGHATRVCSSCPFEVPKKARHPRF